MKVVRSQDSMVSTVTRPQAGQLGFKFQQE